MRRCLGRCFRVGGLFRAVFRISGAAVGDDQLIADQHRILDRRIEFNQFIHRDAKFAGNRPWGIPFLNNIGLLFRRSGSGFFGLGFRFFFWCCVSRFCFFRRCVGRFGAAGSGVTDQSQLITNEHRILNGRIEFDQFIHSHAKLTGNRPRRVAFLNGVGLWSVCRFRICFNSA